MTSPPYTEFTDVENAHRLWLRGKIETVAGRVLFAYPEQRPDEPDPVLPLITVQRVGGGPLGGEAPLDDARLSYECWGRNKREADIAARALVGLLRDTAGVQLSDDVYLYGVHDITTLWAPDDEAKLARYIVTATSTVR